MSNRNLAAAPPQICNAGPSPSRSLGASIMETLRTAPHRFVAWRKYRRQRAELYAFLASDHRIAADIGYQHIDGERTNRPRLSARSRESGDPSAKNLAGFPLTR